jgi:hypothetical protein
MDEHLVALEKCMQQLQEAVRRALARHDIAQVHLLGAELTRLRRAWKALCGLDDIPGAAAQSELAPVAAESGRCLPVSGQARQASALLGPWAKTGRPE